MQEVEPKVSPQKDVNDSSTRSSTKRRRIPRGSRRKLKEALPASPKKTSTVPLLTQTAEVSPARNNKNNKSRTESNNDVNSISRIPHRAASTQNQTQTLINESVNSQYESKISRSKVVRPRRLSSKSSVNSGRTKRVLGRVATQHSLNISNIEELGIEDTGVEVSDVLCFHII